MRYRSKTIPTDRHVAVCGMTRTGKSYLCERYLSNYKYVVKLDTKHETDERLRKKEPVWKGVPESSYTITNTFSGIDDIDTDKIVYQVPFEEQNVDSYNRFFRWIFERENTIVWIDELMSLGNANSYPIELHRLMIMGNSKNISCWCCTQRPSGIPTIVLANCTYIFCFNLNLPADRKKMMEISGCPEMLELPKNHNFWYYQVGDESCIKACLKVK